jgi:hypothetical protein
MTLKRILFVGYLWPGSTCIPRFNGLRAIGLDVEALDATGWAKGPYRFANSIGHRLYCTPEVLRMNEKMVAAAGKVRPDLVWLEKGNWVYPSTLRRLRKLARFLVHYNTDDVFAAGNWFWLHRKGIRLYDVYLTTNRWNVREIGKRYCVSTMRVGMGYDQDYHRPPSLHTRSDASAQVVFVGHWERHTERYVVALRNSGVVVEVWGHNWWRAKDRALRAVKPLGQGEYVNKIASARIALCSLSRQNRNESTGRSFEIPAIGTLLLAERTLEHEFLFGDGAGAALFTGEKELVEKVHHYLARPEDRCPVAARGHALCRSMGLSWGDHIRREWPLLCGILGEGQGMANCDKDAPFWKGFRLGKAAPHGDCMERGPATRTEACRALEPSGKEA